MNPAEELKAVAWKRAAKIITEWGEHGIPIQTLVQMQGDITDALYDAMTKPPLPELNEAKPVVLYFPDEQAREEFIRLAQQAKPSMEAFKL